MGYYNYLELDQCGSVFHAKIAYRLKLKRECLHRCRLAMSSIELSDSENYAIMIVEAVIFTIMNTIMIVGLCRFLFINTMIKSKGQ